MLQIYYGDGKGKTTAAVGAAIRAVGAGYCVVYAGFLKSRHSSELDVISRLDAVRLILLQEKYPFFKDMTKQQKIKITQEHNRLLDETEAICKSHNGRLLVVWDEILHAFKYSLLDKTRALKIIDTCRESCEIILTGRQITETVLFESADYVTRMKKEKHPLDKGIRAREGIEL